jgi:hypothetical protein
MPIGPKTFSINKRKGPELIIIIALIIRHIIIELFLKI